MPCMIVGVAMRQEFGTWKWVVVAFTYQTVLAWTVALLIYQGGHSWDSEGDMNGFDIFLMILIAGGAVWLLCRSLWKKNGCCSGSECGGCGNHKN